MVDDAADQTVQTYEIQSGGEERMNYINLPDQTTESVKYNERKWLGTFLYLCVIILKRNDNKQLLICISDSTDFFCQLSFNHCP